MDRLLPGRFEVVAPELLPLPERPHDLHARDVRLAQDAREQFVGRHAFIQGRDQRLLEAERAVERPRVAPHLQLMGGGQMPSAEPGRLVAFHRQVDGPLHRLQRRAERHVRRAGIGGIAAEDHQEIDRAALHLADQRPERLDPVIAIAADRLDVPDRLADVAERLVQGEGDGVDGGRLVVPGDHEARTLVLLEVVGDGRDPRLVGRHQPRRAFHPDRRRHGPGERLDLAGLEREPMVGARPDGRRRAFDRVEPVHRVRRHPPEGRERVGIGDVAGPSRQKVRIEREDDLRLREVIDRIDGLAERQFRPEPGIVRPHGLEDGPLRLGMDVPDRLDLIDQGGRGDVAGQDADAGALLRLLLGEGGGEVFVEVFEGADVPFVIDRLRAVGVIQREDFGLGEDVEGPERGGMHRVAFDPGRPAHVALDEHSRGEPSEGQAGGVELGLAGDDGLGGLHVGVERLGLVQAESAAAGAGEQEGGAHQAEEIPPARAVLPGVHVPGELVAEEVDELGGLGDLFEPSPVVAPVLAVEDGAERGQVEPPVGLVPWFHRWHTEQLVRPAKCES